MMNKKIIVLFIFIMIMIMSGIFLVSPFGENDKVSGDVYDAFENNEEVRVVIKLKDVEKQKGFFIKTAKSSEEINAERKQIKDNVIGEIGEGNIKHIFDRTIAVEIDESELNELKKNNYIESIIIDKPIKAFLQQSVPLINASVVWPVNLSGQNITGVDETICIIDTGVDFTHPDLIGKNKTCVIDCVGKACIENCSIGDDNGHGTHVAGIAGASGGIDGVAIGTNLIGVKVLDSTGGGISSDVEAGMNWCIANRIAYNITVISMSLGITYENSSEIPYDEYCDSAYSLDFTPIINNATGNNISVVIATGNNLGAGNITAPACIENATAVGSIRKDDFTFDFNRNNLTDFVAPGYDINSTKNDGTYFPQSGTSMSAPHVAGAFVLFRQFFRLQNGRVPTPFEIENTFNLTGKQINDSGVGRTNLNFSRIDVFAAIQSIDISNPVVSLTSPLNNTVRFSQNVTFNCSANDVQLDNITLYVWNSGGIYNNTEVSDVSWVNGDLSKEIVGMSLGDYVWNCLAYDENNNFSFASFNYSLTVGQIITVLNLPLNNSFVNTNQTYNCSAETKPTKLLTNLTISVWNSTNDLVYNVSSEVNGTTNSSLFYFNFTTEQEYTWNCLSFNNESESDWANNYTITFDISNPEIENVSESSITTSSVIISWDTNESANSSISVNGGSWSNSSDYVTSHSIVVSELFASTGYNYNVTSCDRAGNCNSSDDSFTTSAAAASPSSSSSSSLIVATPVGSVTHDVSVSEVSGGYTKVLKKDDKINFSIFDFEGGRHLLTVDEVGVDYVNLTIESEPISLTLGIGQSVRLNLTSPNYYDLFIKLNNISNGSAELMIQLINEPIEVVVVVEKEVVKEKVVEGKDYFWVVIVLIVVLIMIVFVVIRVNRKKLKGKKANKKGKKKNGKSKKVKT